MPSIPGVGHVVISAPFGNYRSFGDISTSTLGTFTANARRTNANRGSERFWQLGLAWRLLRTLRYRPAMGGWTNKLGLKNPGIYAAMLKLAEAPRTREKPIISIHGFDLNDWRSLCHAIEAVGQAPDPVKFAAVELNVSCPNVEACWNPGQLEQTLKLCRERLPKIPLIAKLSPLGVIQSAEVSVACGMDARHCCNTIPCPAGGLSGSTLHGLTVAAIRDIRDLISDKIAIIGGGGVRDAKTASNMMRAGADHVAIGSALFNPWFGRSKISDIWLEVNGRRINSATADVIAKQLLSTPQQDREELLGSITKNGDYLRQMIHDRMDSCRRRVEAARRSNYR